MVRMETVELPLFKMALGHFNSRSPSGEGMEYGDRSRMELWLFEVVVLATDNTQL